ncbi:50S ribosomal protein L28e [Blastomyces dermatitidis ATCC 18188]|uniref:50S ribosomal protein L28e n=1 Tax=Ajellomyces dermatitidis (strain ATCC 18188 / CBS 674.68) TaxID=653446 RepID=F2TS52_AJEDA|nr:50S ribosomal protein L28e [Blastomyces dermatitidis ATCC 18188]EQL32270.1 large subunit ribosomal protein L28e [Blastomyces dermatitidis ATCC 26199]
MLASPKRKAVGLAAKSCKIIHTSEATSTTTKSLSQSRYPTASLQFLPHRSSRLDSPPAYIMSYAGRPNLSDDVVWEIARTQNSFMVKRAGVQFSRDPLNLVNKHSRKYAGFANSKAIGINATESGNIAVTTKKPAMGHRPASSTVTNTYSSTATSRKIYKGVANTAAKSGYRPDLRAEAVSRVSAIRKSQRPKKEAPVKKARGAKARKAAEESS